MSIHFDFDPVTGITEVFDYCPVTDQVSITASQDETAFLDHMNALRQDPSISAKGIKVDWWHYAGIPNGVILEMKEKHGVDLMARKIDWKKAFKVISREYPALKVTTKTHA